MCFGWWSPSCVADVVTHALLGWTPRWVYRWHGAELVAQYERRAADDARWESEQRAARDARR